MRYVRLLFILISSLSCMQLTAQQKFTWRGYVKDSLSGETLINASIILNNETRGVTTNQYGYFSITLPAGTHQFLFSYVGYSSKNITVDFNKDISQDILLLPVSARIQDVTVTSQRRLNNVKA